MDISTLASRAQDYRVVAGLVLLAVVLQRVLAYPYTRWRTARLNRARGCQPAPRLPSRDPFLALDVVLRLRSLIKEHALLARIPALFEAAGSWSVEVNLAGKRVLWLAEPELVKTVLMTKVKDWRIGESRRETITPAFGPNIIVAEGELWHETRSVMRPAFARKQFGELDLLDMHVSRLLEKLPEDGAEVDLKPLFFKLSMDYSTEFLFGISTDNLAAGDETEGNAFADAIDFLQNAMIAGQFLGKMGALLFNSKMNEATKLVRGTLDKFIDRTKKLISAEKGGEKPADRDKYNVMQEMMQAWPEQTERVRGESTALLVAGRDTTAAALSNLFFYLSRKPEIWRKLRAECLAAPAQPTLEELRALKYLNDCVRESLRIVNPTLDLSRTANEDTILPMGGGPDGKSPLFVEKGTHIQLWIYVMHHRKDLWGPDADDFRPERWEDSNQVPWAYVPFGGGPRICLGQQLSITESMYATFRLARQFETIASTDSRPWTESLAIGTCNAYGVPVKLGKSSK